MRTRSTLFFKQLSPLIGTVAIVCLGLGAGACSGPPVVGGDALMPGDPALNATARDAAAWLAGNYSSARQAEEDPTYFDIRLHIVRIWNERADGAWLYVEQAMADAQATPYRQRIYHVVPAPVDTAESVVFELPGDPLSYAGAWSDPARFNALDPTLLIPRYGCSVLLRRSGPDALKGTTSGDDCGSNLRGAAYATSEVTLTPTQLRSWDRGFDHANKQVWGAVKGPYIFRKLMGGAHPGLEGAPMIPMGTEEAVPNTPAAASAAITQSTPAPFDAGANR